jgi:DNA-binding MarR family transcriptional regulator
MMDRAADAITDLALEVFRLNGELIALGDALVADIGLTSARWQVIGAVALSATPQTIAQIARNMGLARQSVQRVANDLQRQGVLRYAPNPHHRRAKLVLLTRKGETAYAAAMKRWTPRAAALGSGLTAREVTAALDLLRRVRRNITKDATSDRGPS